MTDGHLERERKFDVPLDFDLPPLPGSSATTLEQRATYYDTTAATLQRHGVTLRRRVGGDDDG